MPTDDRPALTAKGRRSREAILRAAAGRFEADGFERTTIRAIATDAGIDPAMVVRYFASKERLFVEATTPTIDIPHAGAVEARDLGAALARHAIELWGSENPGRALRILLRASAHDPQAAARVRSIFESQVRPFLPPGGQDSALRAGMVSSLIMGFAFSRYVVQLPPLVDADDDALADRLALALQAVLDAP